MADRQDEIDSAAADWVARLAGGPPLASGERTALDRWLAASPRHAAAFAEAKAAWAAMGRLGAGPTARHSWVRIAAAASVALALAGGAAIWTGDPRVGIAADYRTAPGSQRLVTLPDGSTVELGPASAIAVDFDDATRGVSLLAGVAYFVPAPRGAAEARPFAVSARGGTVSALGTQFAVRRLPDAVEVAVARHAVEIALDGGEGAAERLVVRAGETVRYDRAGIGAVHAVDPDLAGAWRRGRLVFDRQPLGEVVAEIARYRRGRIAIRDPALAGRAVSGVFDASDTDGALAIIARELGLRTVSLPMLTLLY